jgi:hypothetical protein
MNLANLCNIYNSDKQNKNHSFNGISYIQIYEEYLKNIRNEVKNILEIGVLNGRSLKMWKDYFPNATIYGLDIDPRTKQYEEDRIIIKIASQDDVVQLKNNFNALQFDIIFDDGRHVNKHIISSFEHLFYNNLKSNGLYFIEDLECSYAKLESTHDVRKTWPGMSYNSSENLDNNREDIQSFFNKKIYDLDFKKGQVLFLHFWHQLCAIKKINQ